MKSNNKKELNIYQRKVGNPPFIVRCIYGLIGAFTIGSWKKKINIIDDPRKEKGPCIIIQNHLSRFDHYFISKALFPMKFTYLVAYNEFFRTGQSTFLKLFRCIPKKNSVPDITSYKLLYKLLKSGGKVVIAPEGFTSVDGKNHPIVPGTGKMFKNIGVPIYFAKIEGQYLSATKTCTDIRKGMNFVTISKLYTPEDLNNLTSEEIEDQINDLFTRDEYLWQKEKHYLWKSKGRICKDLEDLCYRCPKCGKIYHMKSYGTRLECTECKNGTTMDDYYDFHPYENSIIPETPSAWSDFERQEIIKEIRQDQNYEFIEEVKLGVLPKDHIVKGGGTSEIKGEGRLIINHTGLHYIGTKDNEPFNIDLNYKEFHTVLGSADFSYFFIYKNGEYFDFFPKLRRCGFHVMLLVEEMHRLHVNAYKCLHKDEYMYKGLELGIDNKNV